MRRDHQERKAAGLRLWSLLEALGISKDKVANGIKVNKSSVCRAFDETGEFAFGRDKLLALQILATQKITETVRAILQLGPAKLDLLSTDYDTSAPCHDKTAKAIIEAVQDSLASRLAGEPSPTRLPNNVFAATIQLGPDQHCLYIVDTRTSNGVPNDDSRIHELEHLSDHFREQARQLRARRTATQERVQLPKKRF